MTTLLSRFQGALVGAVVGDCIGSVFEGLWAPGIAIDRILRQVKKIETASEDVVSEAKDTDVENASKKKIWHFTDDTAMARSVASSLIENKGLNCKDMAKRFVDEYFAEPHRGYGASVGVVFQSLKECNCLDLYGPATRQFDGSGSYGNGGAMRICPLALYGYKYNDGEKLKTMSSSITRITHSHPQAIQGAALEVFAVDQALRISGDVNVDQFIDTLITLIKPMEDESLKDMERINKKRKLEQDSEVTEESKHPYCYKLEKIRRFVKQDELPTALLINEELDPVEDFFKLKDGQFLDKDGQFLDKVVSSWIDGVLKTTKVTIGTDIDALSSVPAAVYAYLRSTKLVESLEDRNAFERTIIYSISLGGDTDTIATMAGAVAGACYGIESIPQSWQKCCEGVQDALKFAEELYKLSQEKEDG